jgi:ubiquitin fusion degradation protein 1
VLSPFYKTNFFLVWQPTDQDAVVEDEPKFKPFTGSGKRLDGKGPKQQAPEVSSAAVPARSAPSDSNKRASQQTAAPSGASTSTRQKTGKLVFGSSASNKKEAQAQKETAKVSEPPKKEEPKFKAFSGKSYSLKS